jgi:uncharacterized protein (DUF58 family)
MPYTLNELLAKVRAIDIASHKRANQMLRGDYRSAFKGTGIQFKEVRNYQYGDDVRNIDWNVSARMQTPHVKVFEEEREQCMLLLLDVSRSNLLGNEQANKQNIIAEVAATLALSALANKEKVGAILFSDKIVKHIPPKHGRDNVLRILTALISESETQSRGTNLETALQLLVATQKRKAEVFILSDFVTPNFSAALKAAAFRHYIAGIHIFHEAEQALPNMGLLQVQDIESGQTNWIDSSAAPVRNAYAQQFTQRIQHNAQLFKNNNAQWLSMSTQHDYVKALHQFFKQK